MAKLHDALRMACCGLASARRQRCYARCDHPLACFCSHSVLSIKLCHCRIRCEEREGQSVFCLAAMAQKRKRTGSEPTKKQAKTEAQKKAPTETEEEKVDPKSMYQAADFNVGYAAKLDDAKKTMFAHKTFSDMKQANSRTDILRL